MKVGDRYSYNGELCTVKYVGLIPAWPGETSIGVEWDNVFKGKHSGVYKDHQYFKKLASVPGAGSFLKSSKKSDQTKTFYEAVVETYGTKYTEQEIKIGIKTVESYGFDKLQILQSDFNNLKNISLSRKCIVGHDEKDDEIVKEGLKNLKELELSFNLFTDLADILKIVKLLNLNGLNLIGNKLIYVSDTFHTYIKTLNLTMTHPSQVVLDSLPHSFPHLTKLLLLNNKFTSLTRSIIDFSSLLHLDISMNYLTEIPKIISQTRIISLSISDNNINVTHNTIYENIKTLDIRRNLIAEWSELDQLTSQFPNVTELLINGNPLFDNKTVEEVEFCIISRWPNLMILNGLKLTEQERINAELYFISKVNDGKIDYDQVKLGKLLEKHERIAMRVMVKKENIKNSIIRLKLKNGEDVFNLDLIESFEFLRVRGLIGRLIKKSVLDFEISYRIGTMKEVIKNDLSLLSSFNFEQGQVLTIE